MNVHITVPHITIYDLFTPLRISIIPNNVHFNKLHLFPCAQLFSVSAMLKLFAGLSSKYLNPVHLPYFLIFSLIVYTHLLPWCSTPFPVMCFQKSDQNNIFIPQPSAVHFPITRWIFHHLHFHMGVILPLYQSINQSILFLIKRYIINALSAVQWNTHIF